jgi:hypothetical protein
MTADWFELAPRFLYMTACGSALLWTITATRCTEIIATFAPLARIQYLKTAAILASLVILAPAVSFVRRGMNLYAMAGNAIWDAAEAAIDAEQEEAGNTGGFPLLLVNLPMRVTPENRIYPLGFEGVTPLPQRVTAEELIATHTGHWHPAQAVAAGMVSGEEPGSYSLLLWGTELGWQELAEATRGAKTVLVTQYTSDDIRLVKTGGAVDESTENTTPIATFTDYTAGQTITLLQVSATCDHEGQISLEAIWDVLAPPENDVTVFAHLMTDAQDSLLSQADGYPMLGMRPFWLWYGGERLWDIRYFDSVPPGDYAIHLGLWELATGTQWEIDSQTENYVTVPVTCQ